MQAFGSPVCPYCTLTNAEEKKVYMLKKCLQCNNQEVLKYYERCPNCSKDKNVSSEKKTSDTKFIEFKGSVKKIL